MKPMIFLLAALFALPGSAFAQEIIKGSLQPMEIRNNVHRSRLGGKRSPAKKARKRAVAKKNYQVDVAVIYGELEGSATFTVQDGAQANHVQGGDKHFRVGKGKHKGAEFKKWGFIVNVLPASIPGRPGYLSLQIQVELSGPIGKTEIKDVTTWQYQTTVTLAEGKTTVLTRRPARLEINVDALDFD